jgi:tetratricopeptide (TPR) repeat protein
MDRAEITKRVERAEKLLQKGKTAEALEDYLQVLAAEPGNDTVCQMAADLCLSLQHIPQAVKLLGDLFERQIEAGDATRASLTYKKLARFVTPTWDQKLRFGDLLEKSHPKQALETYESVFQDLTKQGRKQDSLPALRRVLALHSTTQHLRLFGGISYDWRERSSMDRACLCGRSRRSADCIGVQQESAGTRAGGSRYFCARISDQGRIALRRVA